MQLSLVLGVAGGIFGWRKSLGNSIRARSISGALAAVISLPLLFEISARPGKAAGWSFWLVVLPMLALVGAFAGTLIHFIDREVDRLKGEGPGTRSNE